VIAGDPAQSGPRHFFEPYLTAKKFPYNLVNNFAVGLALFVVTMALNVLAQWFVSRMQEKYE
jgi:hypothetical protein